MHTSQPRMVLANGVELCVQTFGDPDSPAILLIGGAAGSMDWWEDEFCERVASGPRFVIRYDLRDTGQSVSYEAGAPLHDGSDLVEDAVGLLDAFRIARAHVCYSRAARPGRGECRHLPHSLSRCRPRRRGGRERALRVVLFAAAFGAVASPNLLGPSGDLAEALGLNRLAGLYLVAVAAFAAAGLLLAALPRRALPVSADRTVSRRELRAGLRSVRLALIVLAASNLVMVAVMAIAPVHLAEHGHSLDFVGVVVSIQVLCMFAPSPLTGWLADRAGSATVAALGEAFLIAAGAGGALLDTAHRWEMTAVLALLGLGWNAGVVGGSTMLAASAPPALRPQTEGIGEVAMGLAAGAGAPIAGLIVAFGDFGAL